MINREEKSKTSEEYSLKTDTLMPQSEMANMEVISPCSFKNGLLAVIVRATAGNPLVHQNLRYIQILDLKTRTIVSRISNDDIRSMAVLDDDRLITYSYDGMLTIWNVHTGQADKRFLLSEEVNAGVDLIQLKDGRVAAFFSQGRIGILDPEKDTFTIIAKAGSSNGHLQQLPDGRLCTISQKYTEYSIAFPSLIHVWNLETKNCDTCIQLESATATINPFLVLSDDKIAVIEMVNTKIWDIKTGLRVADLDLWDRKKLLLPDGSVACARPRAIEIWDFEKKECIFSIPCPQLVYSICLLPDYRIACVMQHGIQVFDLGLKAKLTQTLKDKFTHFDPHKIVLEYLGASYETKPSLSQSEEKIVGSRVVEPIKLKIIDDFFMIKPEFKALEELPVYRRLPKDKNKHARFFAGENLNTQDELLGEVKESHLSSPLSKSS